MLLQPSDPNGFLLFLSLCDVTRPGDVEGEVVRERGVSRDVGILNCSFVVFPERQDQESRWFLVKFTVSESRQ